MFLRCVPCNRTKDGFQTLATKMKAVKEAMGCQEQRNKKGRLILEEDLLHAHKSSTMTVEAENR